MLERLFSTRKGALAVGLAAAALAGVLLFAYVKQYRHNVSTNTQTTQVLVASQYIQKGTPASQIGKKHLYALKQVPVDQVVAGALTDPSSLSAGTISGSVTTGEIFKDAQLSISSFGVSANPVGTQITGNERALSFPIDTSHTLNGQIAAGDHVDVYVNAGSAGCIYEFLQDLDVLSIAPGGAEITVQTTPSDAARLMAASDGGKIWFTLRPKFGVPAKPNVHACVADLTTVAK
jgi:Flp pilus assembly protein CpaB